MMATNKAAAVHPTVSLFYVHAPQDTSLQQRLEEHLSPLKRQRLISTWSINDIPAGADRKAVLEEHFNKAQVILLLLSSHFNTDENYSIMLDALKRQEEGHTRVIPILLSPTDWETLPVSRLAPLPY